MSNRSSGRSLRLASAAAIGLSTCGLTARALAGGGPIESHTHFAISNPQALPVVTYAHDGILGTSMELLLHAQTRAAADQCHQQVLLEIERLRQILSTYDPTSEIERFKSAPERWPGRRGLGSELQEVLDTYRIWQERTGGAIDINLGRVIALWKSKAHNQPTPLALRRAHATPCALNIDALGKGYIIDKAAKLAQTLIPAGLLNIGGDLKAWGPTVWRIGIANPANPADNAPPLASFDLQNGAVATSGSYARYQLNRATSKRISHLIDPRTLSPADPQNAATVIARDCMTANALSTAACLLDPTEAVALTNEYACAHLIVSAGGLRENLTGVGGGLNPERTLPLGAGTAWPQDFQVQINLTLKAVRGPKVKRPYVAVWVEDSKGKAVRSITIWGTQPKYFRELTEWWNATKGDPKLLRSITRATRQPGQYTINWDGKDDAGNDLPRGDYTIKLEINREHGRHVGELVKLACQDKKVTAAFKATAESDESTVEYGPKAK